MEFKKSRPSESATKIAGGLREGEHFVRWVKVLKEMLHVNANARVVAKRNMLAAVRA